MFFYQEDCEDVYVGGTDFVLKLNGDDYRVMEVRVNELTTVFSFLFPTLYALVCQPAVYKVSSCFIDGLPACLVVQLGRS